jgi:MFS family permease
MPTAMAAMGMKFFSVRVLRRFGFRQVLVVNTVMSGLAICAFSLVTPASPIALIICMGLAQGFFNSLQFTSINSMAYADIEPRDSSMAATIASTLQQMSLGFGLACGSLITGWYLAGLPQTDAVAVSSALHRAFLTLGGLTIVSSLSFWTLRASDGENVSRGNSQAEVQSA